MDRVTETVSHGCAYQDSLISRAMVVSVPLTGLFSFLSLLADANGRRLFSTERRTPKGDCRRVARLQFRNGSFALLRNQKLCSTIPQGGAAM